MVTLPFYAAIYKAGYSSMRDLAGAAGVSPSTVSRMAKGMNANIDACHAVSRALGITLDDLYALMKELDDE
jgi:transcriptional regulator with XRE-family HTH domain